MPLYSNQTGLQPPQSTQMCTGSGTTASFATEGNRFRTQIFRPGTPRTTDGSENQEILGSRTPLDMLVKKGKMIFAGS
jgi:hypothetical protein